MVAFKQVNLVEKEQFADFNLSQYLLLNYPNLEFNIAPTDPETGAIQVNIQLALFNIISMVSTLYCIL